MNLDFEKARTTRKMTYDNLSKLTSWNSEASAMEHAGFYEVTDECDRQPEIFLQSLMDEFEANTFSNTQISQRKIRIQRETSARILSNIHKLLLKPHIRRDVIVGEYFICGQNAIKAAVEFLINHWGVGDIQICNFLIETLLQSYKMAPRICENVLLQEYMLYDLLPCAIGGDMENCIHLHSAIAKTLTHALSQCGSNSRMYIPIIGWCKWYMNFYHFQQPCRIVRSEALSNHIATTSLPIPAEMYQLGLELLRMVPTVDLIPIAFSINLDFYAFGIKCESIDTLSQRQHCKDLIVTLRQRWRKLFLSQELTCDAAMREEKHIMDCKCQLFHLFEIAIFDMDMNQGHLLTNAYIDLLQTATNTCNREIAELQSYGRQTPSAKRRSGSDLQNSRTCHIEFNILTIDWIFVMILISVSNYQTMATEIVDSWIPRESCDSLLEVMKIVSTTSKVSEFPSELPNFLHYTTNHKSAEQRFISCLLQTAHVLILKPQRDYDSGRDLLSSDKLMQFASDSHATATSFILSLFAHLDLNHQKKLTTMLLYVVDDCLIRIDSNDDEADKEQSSASTVIGTVFTILQEVTRVIPLKLHLKNKLIERLTSPRLTGTSSPWNTHVDQGISSLLVSLIDPIKNNNVRIENSCARADVLCLLQKLLLAEGIRSSRLSTIRGVLLATELIATKHYYALSIDDRKLIYEWVLRLLLPCTRRMIEPELGLAGLSFVNTYFIANKKMSTNESMFFQHIKMMVGNTGLVQLSDNTRELGVENMTRVAPHVVIAYTSTAIIQRSTNIDQDVPNALLFGMNFVLRRSNDVLTNPSRWLSTAEWVFALMDTYLQLGRTRVTKSWNPMNWLRAPLEFPSIDTSFFNQATASQHLIMDFIDDKICRFELTNGIQENSAFPMSYAELVVRRLYSKKLKLFIDSLRCFSVALLIGIFLSSAVLKNAYEIEETRNNTSLSLQSDIILQIMKIYDLRAKSTTMDSLLAAIASVLRRSWIRKRKVNVLLSDDSRNSGKNFGSARAGSRQDIDILDSLSKILKATRHLRESVFSGTKYIGSQVLWLALKDSDGETIHKSLQSLMSISDEKLIQESVMKLSRTVGTKIQIIQQILEQFERSSLSYSDSLRSNIQFCFVEISFFIPWLAKLRKKCAELKSTTGEVIILQMEQSLAFLVRITSSYLQVIALFLQRLCHNYRLRGDTDLCMPSDTLCEELGIHFDTFLSDTGQSHVPRTTTQRLFNFFADHLNSTEYAEIAGNILEILTAIAILDDTLAIQLFDLSWTHLRTVYSFTEAYKKSQLMRCPFAITVSMSVRARSSSPMEKESLARIVNGILQNLLRSMNSYESHYLHLHVGLIRHWGILTASRDVRFSLLLRNLTTLVTTLKSHLDSVRLSVTRKALSDEKGTNYTRTQKSLEAPPVVGLELATFPEFFETLLNLVIATAGTWTSGPLTKKRPANECMLECAAIFRSLINIYKDDISFFPSKSALTICCVSKDLLLIAIFQLQHGVECRNDQPFISGVERTYWVHEADDILSLEDIKDSMLSCIIAPLLSLCDIWETSTTILKKSKLLSLRLALEKAKRQINDISHPRSMSGRSFKMERDKLDGRSHRKDFGMDTQLENTSDRELSLLSQLQDDNAANWKPHDSTTVHFDDDDDLFEVEGKWGDGLNADDQSDSMCSLNIENPVSILFHGKASSPFASH